ncbi:TPA: hypothetical protein ACS7XC_002343 [Providencia alcalifaciens]|uniref:hypothetical protein n=1 Tax=Providencia alcalifaciens TaxID=126385 RepID=UPI0015CFD3CA|nr:hypothetical protein [Providencia alcalifaciens]MBF0693022.1 hypothetical protein [Providencia alcalifaciens]NYS91526.1 hypothetical protein [Providencia alcalifaciens]
MMKIDQIKLISAIAKEIDRQTKGIEVTPAQFNVIISAATKITNALNNKQNDAHVSFIIGRE